MLSIFYRHTYLTLLILSFIVTVCFFYGWNNRRVAHFSELSTENNNSLHYFIDECDLKSSHVLIQGWIFSDRYPEYGQLVVTIKGRKHEYFLPVATVLRPDIDKHFNRDSIYKKVGFVAAINKLLLPKKLRNEINIRIIDGKKVNRVTYVCKQ